ncbi:MAG: ABC transporter substrate-binding protein [Burkholderiales bacterium]|nr:ABC transporter substrate-binding protein [Burkholderiales bacterium]
MANTRWFDLAMALAMVVAAPAALAQAGTVRLGLLTSMTGPAAGTGLDQQRAATLAVEEINAAGGVSVGGKKLKLELVTGDDQTSREGAVSGVTRLLVEDKVDVVFGGLGSAFGMAALPLIRDRGVPYIPTPSTPLFTRTMELGPDPTKSMVFHYQGTGLMYGAATADFIAQALRRGERAKVVWLYQDSPFGAEYVRGYSDRIKERNLPLDTVATERFKVGETDYRAQLTKIKALAPDVLVPMGFRGETVAMIQQAVLDVGLDRKKTAIGPVCACADDPLYYKDLGRVGEYTTILSLYSTYAAPKNRLFARWEPFRELFVKRYGILPGVMGVSAYDSVHIAAKAIELAGSLDKAKIVDALGRLEMDQQVLPVNGGKLRFDPKFREVDFYLIAQQLLWDDKVKELRPVVVWPHEVAEAKYRQP